MLDRSGRGDQFLWFHYFDAHAPYGDTQNPSSVFVPEVIVEQIVARGRAPSRVLPRARELYRADARFLDGELARARTAGRRCRALRHARRPRGRPRREPGRGRCRGPREDPDGRDPARAAGRRHAARHAGRERRARRIGGPPAEQAAAPAGATIDARFL
jgi:hypothetical protein